MPEVAFTCLVTSCWRMRWIDDIGADVVISVGLQRVAAFRFQDCVITPYPQPFRSARGHPVHSREWTG